MSNLKVNQVTADKWLNSDGTENFKVRAWVNFNGTGNVSINSSGNVSSIIDLGVGQYTINFKEAFVDSQYAVTFGTSDLLTGEATPKVLTVGGAGQVPVLKTTTAVTVGHVNGSDTYDFSVVVVR